MLAVGFLPLFGGPGYEHSLATGLIVPTAVAIASARAAQSKKTNPSESARLRARLPASPTPRISLFTAFVHVLRIGICEVWGALLYFALTAGIGCDDGRRMGLRRRRSSCTASSCDAGLGAHPRSSRCSLCLTAATLGGALVSLWRFFASPMIFAYDPFVGYFSGTLYDTVIDAGTPMLTYRIGSFCTLVALALAASMLRAREQSPFDLVQFSEAAAQRSAAVLALIATLTSVSLVLFGAKLGHYSTTPSIIADLGAEKHGARCDVVYPSTTSEQQAKLLVKDCDEEVTAVEARLGTQGPARIRAFFFRDAADKKRLMGAEHTYIAKPWREEVYLQMGGYPHPVLGHELAHVIAGSFGRGPFKVAGAASRWHASRIRASSKASPSWPRPKTRTSPTSNGRARCSRSGSCRRWSESSRSASSATHRPRAIRSPAPSSIGCARSGAWTKCARGTAARRSRR